MINNDGLTKGTLSSRFIFICIRTFYVYVFIICSPFLFACGFSADQGSSTKGTRVLKQKDLNHKLSFSQHITNTQRG